MQLAFVKEKLGQIGGKQILDIGCATGELAFRLAKSSANVIGIDLNEDLLKQAGGCSEKGLADSIPPLKSADWNPLHPNPEFLKRNMLELKQDFHPAQFDAVLCFGNTLVHSQSEEKVLEMLKGTHAVLKSGGQFLMQILNYDYIVGEQVSELPLIETENIKFIRKYEFSENSSTILFQTDLEIKAEQKTVSNETPLFAIKSKTLIRLLEKAGFKNIQLYSNFKQDVFGGKHIPLIVSCEK